MKYITTTIAALFLLSGCDNAPTASPERPAQEVGIVTLKSQPVSVVSDLTGRTTAALSAEVRPQVSGIIQKRLFNEGDNVKAGQPLYQIDPASFRATYNEAAAALKQAQALVTAEQTTTLATIRGLDTIYVDLTRSSVDLLRLRKQSLATNSDTLSVTLTLEDGSTYSEKGRLALTEVAVDESTGSVTLRAVFPNPHQQLLPGMFVRARIDEGVMSDAILAPQQGITRGVKGNATALVVDANNKVEQRTLETDGTYGDKWLVQSGLKNGDQLIVEGTDKVTVGQTVKPVAVQHNGGKA